MKDERTSGERIADSVARFGGSWKFIIFFSIIIIGWMLVNTLAFLDILAWDKPPFILLNLLLSFIAAFQAPFIMMSQNRAEKKQDRAYRMLFQELKELLEQDIDLEKEIEQLSREIKKEQQAVRLQHTHLLAILQKAIIRSQEE